MSNDPLDRAEIARVAELVAPYIRHTPWLDLEPGFFAGLDTAPALKLELLQHTGSFKVRGAFANLLAREIAPAGVVAASGGNHGAAVAYAARALGVPASIFVPEVTPAAKLDRIRSYGARLVVGGARYAEALEASRAYAAETGASEIHAYDQVETLLGQGTLGREMAEDRPEIDTVVVAVGGGGLIGGIAAWMRGAKRVVAVEPEGAPTLARALEAGRPVDAPAGSIAADSLAPRQVGQLMFPVAQAHVSEVVLVSDAEIRAAQIRLWDDCRLVAEPGGAAAFAALNAGKYRPGPGERVAVLVCGSNTDAVRFG
jgi:threonine dehydratase